MILLSLLRLRKRFDIVICISTFYALVGILLKRFKLARNVIYYCLDYPPQQAFIPSVVRRMDKYCVISCDVTWNLTPEITKARYNGSPSNLKTTKELYVPLTYSSRLLTLRPLNEIERYTIVFIGTLDKLQGVQLLVEAMPAIVQTIPEVKVRIIGDGPYRFELHKLITDYGLKDYFTLHGFIRDDSEVLDIISRCAVGIAPYIPVKENNALNADPGKVKLYTFCGLPVIITKIPSGLRISEKNAGIAIDYKAEELANAIFTILSDDETLGAYRNNASKFARSYTSERIFEKAFEKSIEIINRKGGYI